jgi:raffinose/stachyose/melibiose transport system substrate-binding protein
MTTSIAAGSIPDIFIVKSGSKAEPFFKSGKLMDLTSYMNDGWKDRFIESSLQTVLYDGKTQAVPYEFGVTPVLYNAKLLKEVGYDKFPETYTEFFEMCEALKAKGIAANAQMTADNAWTSMLWYSQIVHSIGGADVFKKGLDDPAYLEAAKIMKKMFDYTTNDAVGAKAAVAAGHFLNERTATLMNGPWFIGRIKTEGINSLYDNTEVAPAPYYEGGKGAKGGYVGFVQANICAAKQDDKAKEEAVVKFLKYITEPENVKKISMASGAMFVVKTNVGANDEIERLQGQMMKQSSEAPYVVPHFEMSVSASVATEFPQALSALVLNDITPEQFIEMLKSAE